MKNNFNSYSIIFDVGLLIRRKIRKFINIIEFNYEIKNFKYYEDKGFINSIFYLNFDSTQDTYDEILNTLKLYEYKNS
jgi:hypothetical protein